MNSVIQKRGLRRMSALGILIVLLLGAIAPAHAQNFIVPNVYSGDGQSAAAGTQLAQAFQVQFGGDYQTGPGSVDVVWTVTSGDANFNGSATEMDTYAFDANTDVHGLIVAPMENLTLGTFLPGSAYPHQVTITALCTSSYVVCSSAPATFTATILPNQISVNGGNSQIGYPNAALPVPLSVTFANASPVSSLQWQVTGGDATFSESNTTLYVVPNVGQVGPGSTLNAHLVLGTTPGPVTVQATCGSCGTGSQTLTFNETLALNNTISISAGNNQTGFTGQQLATPLAVAFTNAAPITSLQWKVTGGDATFTESGSTTYTDPNANSPTAGQTASASLDFGTTVGPVTVQTICTGCSTGSQSLTFNENVSAAAEYLQMTVISGNGQRGTSNSTLAQPLKVKLTPATQGYNGPAPVPITWSIVSGSAQFAANHSTSYTQSVDVGSISSPHAGDASVAIELGNTPGKVVVQVACSDCSSGANRRFLLTITESTTIAKVSGDNQTGVLGSASDLPLVVQLGNSGGTTGSLANKIVAWSVVGGQATLGAASSQTDANGVASIDFSYGATPGPVIIRATSANASVDFTATALSATASAVSGNNQTGIVGQTLQPFVVQIAPAASGKGLSRVPVTWRVISGGGNLSAVTTYTDANGRASDTLTLGSQPGANSVSVSLPGNVVVQFDATAIAAGSASAILQTGSGQVGATSSLLQPFVVHVSQGSQPLAGFSVEWSIQQGDGSLLTLSTLTDSNGDASNILTLGPNPGNNVVLASVPGVGVVTFTAIASAQVDADSTFSIVSGNNQALVPNIPSDPLLVRLVGRDGKPIANAAVQWSVSATTGTLTDATTTTDSDGQSSNRLSVSTSGDYSVTVKLPDATGVTALKFTFSSGLANFPGLSPNQRLVANALDNACPALAAMPPGQLTPGQQDLLQRCSEVIAGASGDPSHVPPALTQMLNNKVLPQRTQALGVQQGQLGNLNTRFAELRQGVHGASAQGLAMVNDGRSLPLATFGELFRKDPKADDEIGRDFARWGFFATGMVEHGGYSANSQSPGFDFDNDSLTAGVDYRFTDSFVAGVAAGYNHNSTQLDQSVGHLGVDGYSLNGYFTWYHNDAFYVEGSVVLDWLNYDLQRNIAYQIANLAGTGTTDVKQTATASPDGHQTALSLSVGRDFNHGAWALSPYLRAVYSRLSLDGFSETASDPGAPGAGLVTSVESRSLSNALGVIGGRLSHTTSFDWGVLIPNATLEFNHEFRNDPQTIVTRFVFDPTQTPITLTDQPPDSSYFNVGIGLNAVFPNGRSGFIAWEHLVGFAGAHENRFSLGIRIEF